MTVRACRPTSAGDDFSDVKREGYFWWEPREQVGLDRIGELPADLQGHLI